MTDEHQIDGTTVSEKLANNDIAGYFDELIARNTPDSPNDVANKDYVDSSQAGLDWQESVLARQNTPPSSPSTGDRYLVDTSPTGDWVGHANEIAEWDGSAWDFTVPDEGFAVFIEDTDSLLAYGGSNWISFGSVIDHGALGGLTDDDHTQYLLVDGTRAMSGSLDMGTNAITNASTGTFSGSVSAGSVDAGSSAEADQYTVDGSNALLSVAASGQTTLSGGTATVDTGISATDATFYLGLGVDDPNADVELAGKFLWDDTAGTYKVVIDEIDTAVGNPTVNYDVLRIR